MNDKEIYQKKLQAQLDGWKAEVDKLKAKASDASADAQMDINEQIKTLEAKIEEGKAKIAEVEESSEGAWESLKEGFDSAWESISSAFNDALNKFK